jgi:hypothetical protein
MVAKLILRDHVRGNKKIRPDGWKHPYTEWELEEFQKCAADPIYFIRNYVKIISLDKGIINFDMFPFQEKYIRMLLENRKSICKLFRQGGKTTCTAAAICWYIIFNKNKNVAVLANKSKGAREILARIKLMYEELPQFLKHGVREWNKGFIQLSNGSKVTADATSANAARGSSLNWLYLDEYAFVGGNIADEFFTSVFPTLSSGKTTKISITSTPIGYNHFWKMWDEAEKGINGFQTFTADYWERPGYDEQWAADQRRVLGDLKFRQEILMAFLGSSNTLIAGDFIAKITPYEYIFENDDGLDVIEAPTPGHTYVGIVDTSRGVGGDSSVVTMIDITEVPYKLVAKYKSNTVHPMLFSTICYKMGKDYNDAFLLVEINDNGQSISDALMHDMEYENLLWVSKGKGGQQVSSGFGRSGATVQSGVRTDKLVKRVGCSTLKTLIEENKLLVNDRDFIQEFSTFTEIKGSFAADVGYHDDLVMTLVLFAWLTNSPYFKELTNVNLRTTIYQQRIEEIEAHLTPFGIRDNHIDQEQEIEVIDRDVWMVEDADRTKDFFRRTMQVGEWPGMYTNR